MKLYPKVKTLFFIGTLLTGYFLNPETGLSQDKSIVQGNQQWVQYYNQTKISNKWSLLIDGGFRWKEDLLNRSQYIVRAAGGYSINKGVRVGAGMAHLGTYTDIEVTVAEFRPYQEVSLKHPGNLGLSQRLRIEQRFIKATANHDQQFKRFNWRFRYFIGIAIPIVRFSGHSDRSLKLQIGDEIFLNAGKDIIYNIFDQNRLLIGPSFQLNESLTFAFTYNGKFSSLNLPSKYTYNHILWLSIRQNIDLSKNLE